jgi:hypothetical protein
MNKEVVNLRMLYNKMQKILLNIEGGTYSVIPIKIPLKLRATSLVGSSAMYSEMQTISSLASLPSSPKDIEQTIKNTQNECKYGMLLELYPIS